MARSHVVSLVLAGTLVLGTGMALAEGGLPEEPTLVVAPGEGSATGTTADPALVDAAEPEGATGAPSDLTGPAEGDVETPGAGAPADDEADVVEDVADVVDDVARAAGDAAPSEDQPAVAEEPDDEAAESERPEPSGPGGAGDEAPAPERTRADEAGRRVSHGACVSEVARAAARGPGADHGAAVSAVARSQAGKAGAGCDGTAPVPPGGGDRPGGRGKGPKG